MSPGTGWLRSSVASRLPTSLGDEPTGPCKGGSAPVGLAATAAVASGRELLLAATALTDTDTLLAEASMTHVAQARDNKNQSEGRW